MFDSDIDFTLKYLNVEYLCKKIYKKVKDFDGKFVLIGHSMGAVYVYKFAQMYKERCLFSVLLDGSMIGENALHGHIKNMELQEWFEENNSFENINDEHLKEIIVGVKNHEKENIRKLDNFIYYKIQNQQPHDKIIKLPIPTISFRNIEKTKGDIDEEIKSAEGKMLEQNNSDFKIIYVYDKTHFVHKNPDVIMLIIQEIKKYLRLFNKQSGGNNYFLKYKKYKHKYLSLLKNFS